MKGLILLQNLFEDTEALTTIDVLSRAGHTIKKVNMSMSNIITTQYGNNLLVDTFLNGINADDYDFLVIPGGRAVSMYLQKDERVYDLIKKFDDKKKLIACICAAPSLLSRLNIKEFTCYPSFEKFLKGKYINTGVVKSENYITAKSMYYTIDFALEIVKYFDSKSNLVDSLKGE